jgi:hypothetical protein
MIIEILLALFLVLVLRLLDGVERRRDVLHYVTKPSRARATMPADLSGRAKSFYRGGRKKLIAPTVPEQSSQ